MNKIIFFILIVLIFPTLSADVISLNSGGSPNIVINPDIYIEGFFSCIPYTCTSLGYNCGTWSDGCGGTLNCGTCASGYTCTSGICVAVPVTPVTPGGGAGAVTPTVSLLVSPTEFNIDLAINTNKEEVVKVTNLGTSFVNVSVRQTDLDNMVLFEQSFLELSAGESKNLDG